MDRGEGGAGRAIALPFFTWVDFLGLQTRRITYELYHLNACLSWPDFLALPLSNGLRGPCDVNLLEGVNKVN